MYISLFYKPIFFADQFKLMGERLEVRGEGGGVCVSRKSLINKKFSLIRQQKSVARQVKYSAHEVKYSACQQKSSAREVKSSVCRKKLRCAR